MSAVTAKTAEATDTEVAVSEPTVRENVLGTKVTVVWLGAFLIGAVGLTVATMTFIDGRIEEKVSRVEEKVGFVRTDMHELREDMKDGFREVKDDLRTLRDVVKR